jgi:hypothetical protein
LVWQDRRSGGFGPGIYGARFNSSGTVIANGFPVSTGGTRTDPDVAWNGEYLVAWTDSRGGTEVWAARVSAEGVVKDTNGFRVDSSAGDDPDPAVAPAAGSKHWTVVDTFHDPDFPTVDLFTTPAPK